MSYLALPLDVVRIIIGKLDPESAAFFRCVHRQSHDIIKKAQPRLLEKCKNKLYIYATNYVNLLEWLSTNQRCAHTVIPQKKSDIINSLSLIIQNPSAWTLYDHTFALRSSDAKEFACA